jgi:hypothetical protein
MTYRDRDAIGALCIMVLACLCGSFFVYGKLARYEVPMTVSGQDWTRIVPIEVYSVVDENSSRYRVPADAYDIRYYQDCDTTCDMDGNCDTDCESRARYKVNRWIWSHDLSTVGDISVLRYWPDWVDDPNDGKIGRRRAARRREVFCTHFKGNNDTHAVFCGENEASWRPFLTGERWRVTFNRWNEPIWGDEKREDMR